MNILITAGNTQTPIDRVRCITNIFTGRTGARIALEAWARGHAVTLLTSQPETVAPGHGIMVKPYRTFDDLEALLTELVPTGKFDAIIHSAAVSDYALAGVYSGSASELIGEPNSGKIKSTHPELWMKLVPTPKLVDWMRARWHFRGVLVKFKLEVGVNDSELVSIAKKSRLQSDADFLVANTLDSYETAAWIVDRSDSAFRVVRAELPKVLLNRIEQIFSAPRGGEPSKM
jgi:phosphopantothenate---cysteine ligase (CTP)